MILILDLVSQSRKERMQNGEVIVIYETLCGCSKAITIQGELKEVVLVPLIPKFNAWKGIKSDTMKESDTVKIRKFRFKNFDRGNNIARYVEIEE